MASVNNGPCLVKHAEGCGLPHWAAHTGLSVMSHPIVLQDEEGGQECQVESRACERLLVTGHQSRT